MLEAALVSTQASFADPILAERFEEKGFVLTDRQIPEDILQAVEEAYYRDRHHYLRDRYISTMELHDADHRLRINALFADVAGEIAKSLFTGYVQYYGGFGIKHPTGDASILSLHQDLTMVPYEAARTGLTIWIPLSDVDYRNGCVQVVPGSHVLNRRPRAPGMEYAFSDIESWICDELLKCVPMRRGQVLVMDQALSHRSGPNNSDRERIAIMGMFRPRETPLVYYLQAQDGDMLDVFEVPDDFYLRQQLGAKPCQGSYCGRIPRVVEPFPAAGFGAGAEQ
jgi:hypothetical protein